MKKFCLIANERTRAADVNVPEILSYISGHGAECHELPNRHGNEPSSTGESFIDMEKLLPDTECAIVLGGDGTILQSARQLAERDIPILAINLGTFGFLADGEKEDMHSAIDHVLHEDYKIERRLMLDGSVISDGREIYTSNALNDIVVARSGIVRVISTTVYVDKTEFNSFKGDGIIVSTPTGSTGYNLSAGGPILMPGTASFAITPICPHSFNLHGIVAPCRSEVTIEVVQSKKTQSEEAIVSFDGNRGIRINAGARVRVKMAKETLSFIRTPGYEFLNVLREKIHGGRI